MIHRFLQVNPKLFRGSAPSIEDVIFLNKKLGIKKIISLDYQAGKHIDRATKLLGMKHIMMPIDINHRSSLLKVLNQDLYKLLMKDGPTFIHCIEGKDRTGLVIALFRCQYDDWTCEEALTEAKSFGFGIGLTKKVKNLYTKIVERVCDCNGKHSGKDKDFGLAYDIVSNQREYPSDYRDYTLDTWEQASWSPYEDYRVKEFPYANTEIDWPEQYQSRQNYRLDDSEYMDEYHGPGLPQSGTYDTSTSGIMGAGPSLVGSGYI